MLDNYHFDITDVTELHGWIKRCVSGGWRSAVGWSMHDDDKGQRIVFYWCKPNPNKVNGYTPLPFRAGHEQIAMIAEGWLESIEYPPEPDHDGSNGKGFRIFNEDWGHVDNNEEAFLAVSPVWAMYGK